MQIRLGLLSSISLAFSDAIISKPSLDAASFEEEEIGFKKERYLGAGKNVRIKVKLKGNKKTRKQFLKKYSSAKNILSIKTNNVVGMTVDKDSVKEIQNDPDVKLVEKDHVVKALGSRLKKHDIEEHMRKLVETVPWGIPTVLEDVGFWNDLTTGSPIKVCVADTGYDLGHEDLPIEPDVIGTDGYDEPWNEDPDVDAHGTHVAGTVAALGNNNIGVTGIFPNNKGGKFQLVIGKALDSDGFGTEAGVMKAVEECVAKGAKVVSMSLGCDACYSQIEDEFFQTLYDKGVLTIAAAGNSGSSVYGHPASYASVVSIASIDESLRRSSFSTYNDQVELSGPGGNVLSAFKNNGYISYSGTSMATPHVAGVAALVWMHFPDCTNQQIRNVLAATAKDLDASGCEGNTGFGLVQAKAAYEFLSVDKNCGGDLGAIIAVGGCDQLKPPCQSDLTCDDGDPCTRDTCVAETGECAHELEDCSICGKETATIKIMTDEFPEETSWTVTNNQNEQVASSDFGSGGKAMNTLYEQNVCLEGGDYVFTIFDAYGDGMCCDWGEGYYEFYVQGALVGSGGEFGFSESFGFSVNGSPGKKTKKKNKKKKKKAKKGNK